ncbi:hypothetical protein ACHAXS_011016 [Conticribra weissflogii]
MSFRIMCGTRFSQKGCKTILPLGFTAIRSKVSITSISWRRPVILSEERHFEDESFCPDQGEI